MCIRRLQDVLRNIVSASSTADDRKLECWLNPGLTLFMRMNPTLNLVCLVIIFDVLTVLDYFVFISQYSACWLHFRPSSLHMYVFITLRFHWLQQQQRGLLVHLPVPGGHSLCEQVHGHKQLAQHFPPDPTEQNPYSEPKCSGHLPAEHYRPVCTREMSLSTSPFFQRIN